jgi:hypothetical protein
MRTTILRGQWGAPDRSAGLDREAEQVSSRSGKLADAPPGDAGRLPILVKLFLISIYVPWRFTAGGALLPLYRIVLLVVLVACLWRLISGKFGSLRVTDVFLLLYCFWTAAALVTIYGAGVAAKPAFSYFLDTFVPYFFARSYIGNFGDVYRYVRFQFTLTLILLPAALYECLSGNDIALKFFGQFAPVWPYFVNVPRLGLFRVQAVFEHPILYGVTAGSISAMLLAVNYRRSFIYRSGVTCLNVFASLLSLSAGPITAIAVQFTLLAWERVLKPIAWRWWILAGGIFGAYLFVAIFSNKGPMEFYLSYFSFDYSTAYYRILIWDYASASALAHPLFGIGFKDWERLSWMTNDTIDNYWLLQAVLFGIPAAFFVISAVVSAILSSARAQLTDDGDKRLRNSYVVVLVGYFVVGGTVDFWNATLAHFMFLLGSCMWLSQPRPISDRPLGDAGRRVVTG